MRAVVLSIGSELLRGDIVDTNAGFLARELSYRGFELLRVQQVGDDLELLTETFHDALEDAGVTLATGGLGPTQDDLTRQAIAASLGENLSCDEHALAGIRARFKAMGRRMPESNRQQAFV